MSDYEKEAQDIVRFQIVTTREIKYKLKGLAGLQGLNLTVLANELFRQYIKNNEDKLLSRRSNELSRSNENDVV